jgi:hypothetical protein
MKTKHVVFSSADQGTECFIDFVMAESEERAKEEVGSVRYYALPVFATDLRSLYEMTRDLAVATSEEVESSWNEVKAMLQARDCSK